MIHFFLFERVIKSTYQYVTKETLIFSLSYKTVMNGSFIISLSNH